MAVHAAELTDGDPRQLGGFRLEGRLHTTSLGVVYLGRAGSGELAGVAVLNSGAGADKGSRERFVEAVGAGETVLAARTHGSSPLWVAVPYEEGSPGAETFLERAGRGGRVSGRGPTVMPHWAGERTGMRWASGAGARDSAATSREGNWGLIGGVGVALLLLLLLVTLLYWWMLQFPQPEMPMVQPEMEVEPSPEEGSPPEQEGEEGAPAEPTPMPTPSSGEGEGEWEEQPEDNL